MATGSGPETATVRWMADRRSHWFRRTLVRAATIATIAAAMVAAPAIPASSEPASGPPVLGASHGTRGSTITVTTTGCSEPGQFVEARLVVGRFFKHSVAVSLADRPWGSSPATTELIVPKWSQSGPAIVEASCLEDPVSAESDGIPDVAFDYEPVSYRVDWGSPARAPRVKIPVVTDGTLRVSGNGCNGAVTVEVARGLRMIATRAEFLPLSLATGHGDSNGRWSAEGQLQYAAGEYSTNLAPGPMTAFASCDGVALPASFFWISSHSPAPGVHLGWSDTAAGPHLNLYLMQCADGNTINARAVTNDGANSTTVSATAPGRERYGADVSLTLPPGTVSASISARCQGWRGINWSYEPLIWTPASPQF